MPAREEAQPTDANMIDMGTADPGLSRYVELNQGDLIYTGTPEGVGPIARGDTVTGRIEGLGGLRIQVAS